MDAEMAGKTELWAAMGDPFAPHLIADGFLKEHSEYGWMRGLLREMKTEPWTQFASGMK